MTAVTEVKEWANQEEDNKRSCDFLEGKFSHFGSRSLRAKLRPVVLQTKEIEMVNFNEVQDKDKCRNEEMQIDN